MRQERSLALAAGLERKKVSLSSTDFPDGLHPVERFDLQVIDALEPLLGSGPAKALGQLGNAGDEPPLIALSAAILLNGLTTGRLRRTRAGLRMLAAHTLVVAAKSAIKARIDRTRPSLWIDQQRYEMKAGLSDEGDLHSFPSGHVAGLTAVARAYSREYPADRLPSYAAAGALAAMQLPRRAHFPSDMAAGLAIGVAAELLVAGVFALVRRAVSTDEEKQSSS